MAFLFQKFQEAVKTLAKSTTFAKDPRHLQFEADINRLFLYTSYNRLGKDADEADVEEIIDLANKASLADQQKQVQENIHSQIKNFCMLMDEILLPVKKIEEQFESTAQVTKNPPQSGLRFALGRTGVSPSNHSAVPETKPLKLAEVSQAIKEHLGYSLAVRPSEIPHKDAGQGLFLEGEAEVGSVIAIYPGVVYSPAYYRYIPGYPKVDAHNSYLITRYDGTVINAHPWGSGDDAREIWDGLRSPQTAKSTEQIVQTGSDRIWKMLSKPLERPKSGILGEILERRNSLAFAHFANHPPKGMDPNVMVCPYDFPLDEKDMRTYIPNISFGNEEGVRMKRFGSFWFKSGSSVHGVSDSPVLKSLVLVATRAINNEEILLNYRLSNTKRRPSWYAPVDEEEDRRRWG
ncbi:SET domain-containing protein 9 [Bienertia sinuspersici]